MNQFILALLMFGASASAQDLPNISASPAPSATPEPLTPSYQSISANIFVPKCLICHTAGGVASDIQLVPYASIMASGIVNAGDAATSALYTKTETGAMPPKSSNEAPLSAEEVTAIQDWINGGALEN